MRSRTGTRRSMSEEDADQKAEMPERPRKVGGGTAEDTGFERQADTAHRGNAGDETSRLMEDVLRRENVLAAYKRGVRNGGAAGVDVVTVEVMMGHCRRPSALAREVL